MIADAELIVDGLIKYMQKNMVARQAILQEAPSGSNIIKVDNTINFNDTEEIALANDSGDIEFHSILYVADSNTIVTVNPLVFSMGPSNGAIVQKAIGNVPLYEDKILFGDREVIPIEEGVAVTVDPDNLSNEWIGVPGLLSEEYSVTMMVYVKGDEFELAKRVSMKYARAIYNLLNTKVHMDIVLDETPITQDLSMGDTIITIPSTESWQPDDALRYEVQDNDNVEIDLAIVDVISPTEIRVNRPVLYNYNSANKLKLIRRAVYIYDSRITGIEYGTVSKSNTLFKAARLSWFGKQTEDYRFPQHSKS
jgi:hypothetical protein